MSRQIFNRALARIVLYIVLTVYAGALIGFVTWMLVMTRSVGMQK